MTIKVRYFYADRGDHIAFRDGSQHVIDPRDLDDHGNPKFSCIAQVKAEPEPGEVEFDHQPTEEELDLAFPNRKKES
jgi:hypothetical protein